MILFKLFIYILKYLRLAILFSKLNITDHQLMGAASSIDNFINIGIFYAFLVY